jgi:hypothetical protein
MMEASSGRFRMGRAIEVFHYASAPLKVIKVVTWVGIPMSCSLNGAAHAFTDVALGQIYKDESSISMVQTLKYV